MKNEFQDFYQDLDEEQKARLSGAIPFLILQIADADDNISLKEVISFIQSLLNSWKEFGDGSVKYFLDGEMTDLHLDDLYTAIEKRKEEIFLNEINNIGQLIQQMPAKLQETYKQFILTSCIKMANASGESFWDNKKISESERAKIKQITNSLNIDLDFDLL